MSTAPNIEVMSVCSDDGGYLLVGSNGGLGEGNWPNYRLIRGRVVEQFVFYLYAYISGLFDRGGGEGGDYC